MWYKTNDNKMINLDKIYTIEKKVTTSNHLMANKPVIWLHYDADATITETIFFDTKEERDIEHAKLENMLLNPLMKVNNE